MYQTTLTTLNHTISSTLAGDFQHAVLPDISSVDWYSMLHHVAYLFSLSFIWKAALTILILVNFKNFPLMYHMRLVNAFRFTCRSQRPKVPLTSANIFQPIITTSRAPLTEIDLNFHKSNSTYFADVDVARAHLLCTLFSKGVAHMRGGTTAITGKKGPMFNLALGATSCTFRKELQPYEQYELWTRVVSWDKKWLYIVTHFVRKEKVKPCAYTLYPHQSDSNASSRRSSVPSSRKGSVSEPESVPLEPSKDLIASSLSRCVFKLGRKTIPPIEMFRLSGLLPPDAPIAALGLEKLSQMPELQVEEKEDVSTQWTWDMVEKERQRGLAVAHSLTVESQQELEREFTGEGEALGRHRDGTGITGVVTTLAQLAHLSNKQFL